MPIKTCTSKSCPKVAVKPAKKDKVENKSTILSSPVIFTFICIAIVFSTVLAASLYSCTLSFTNVSTHGTAEDIVDEDQTANPNIAPNINVPIPG